MKTNFHLEPGMTTFGGVFYPTGYMVLMFATAEAARAACRRLDEHGLEEEDLSLLGPEEFLRQLHGCHGSDDDDQMPSAGTEAATARRLCHLARQGHHALLVHAPTARQSAHVMEVLKDAPISYGQKYRHLIIEDLT